MIEYYEVCSFHYDFLVQFGNLRTGNVLVLVCNPANLVDLDFRMMDLQVITRWSSAVDVASNAEVLCARHAGGRLCDDQRLSAQEAMVDAVSRFARFLACLLYCKLQSYTTISD